MVVVDAGTSAEEGQKASSDEVSNLAWQTYTLLKFGEPAPSSASLPDHFIKHYPINAVWRVRRDQLSATVFGDVTRLMTLQNRRPGSARN